MAVCQEDWYTFYIFSYTLSACTHVRIHSLHVPICVPTNVLIFVCTYKAPIHPGESLTTNPHSNTLRNGLYGGYSSRNFLGHIP